MKTCFPKSLQSNERVCFKTVDSAVFDNNGVPLSDRLNVIKNDINKNTTNHTVLSNRLDNFIALEEEGMDDVDAIRELADIRIGYDGANHDSAGAAVREQITAVYDRIKSVIKHTREAVPRDFNIYDAMYLHDDAKMLYTDYVTYPYPSTVSVPAGYEVMVQVYNYNETNFTYTEYMSSGWTTKYPIPKNKPITIKLRHSDGSDILETETVALMFEDAYPEILKNSILDNIGFYDAIEYRSVNIGYSIFNPTRIATDKILTSDTAMFVKAKKGYVCCVLRYAQNADGSYSSYYDSGWANEQFIDAGNPFVFAFAKQDTTSIIYFDEFINNFEIEEIHLDDEILNDVVRSLQYKGVVRRASDSKFQYTQSSNRLISKYVTYDRPVTFYTDYNGACSIACHIPYADDPSTIEYDSDWGKVITVPAGVNARIFFKNDTETGVMDIRDLYSIKVTTGLIEDSDNPNVKSIAHRGLSTYAPENTLIAYRYAKLQGFKYVECDVSFTSDNVPVLLHDSSIDRTSNGTGDIASITYNTVKSYDFGYSTKFGSAFSGTKIARFDDFIKLCRRNGLHPYIEIKSSVTEAQVVQLLNIVHQYGMDGKVTWISYNIDALKYVKNNNAYARLGFVASRIDSSNITAVSALKLATNEVFIDLDYLSITDAMVNLCINANIPLELFTVDDTATVDNANPYISGITSNWLQAGKYLMRLNS